MSVEMVNFPMRVGESKPWMGYTPPKDLLLHTSVELHQTSFQIMHLVKDVPMSTWSKKLFFLGARIKY